MAKLVPPGGENRTMVKYAEIPEHVLNAVYAAEDADFKTNPGFDISGVMRAAWNQVSGGEGGGSTITQQYIKKATGNEEKSVTRKALEIVKAYKMNNTYTKEEIITAYLNTVYFGRSAYGIAAAAQAYYGNKPLKELSPSEAALLAGMIQSPGRYKDQPYMEKRWNYVMDQMVDKKWLSAADRKAAKFPTLIPVEQARPKGISGPRAHIQRAVFEELEREAGLSEDEIYKGGLTIKTTIQDPIQAKAEAAVSEVLDGEPDNLRTAMVAVNPKNGEILAYYGGKDGAGQDWAQVRQEPGSSFKPFDLVALLQQGKGLGETFDGSNGREFGNITVNNSEGGSCGKECTVKEAMRKSINTVFYDMALNATGTQKVADAAHAAGIKSPLEGANGGPPDGNIAIGGGTTQVSTYEMASAYATFAAQGTYRKPHLVTEVLGPEGGVFWKPDQASLDGVAAFDKANAEKNKKIARNVTEALEPVLDYSDLKCADGRECAGKTGTHQLGETEDNAKAWMVGYTPQVSAAVSMTAEDEQGHQLPVKNAREGIVYGSGLPGEIWQKFMDSYLDGAPKEGFGKFEPIGKDAPKKTSSQQKPPDQSEQPPTQSEQPPSEPEDPTTDPSEPEEPTDPGPTIIPTFPNNNGRGNDPPDGG
jgi:membrane peptidoglycan carboxypeptidase